jgi:hypothetical protein
MSNETKIVKQHNAAQVGESELHLKEPERPGTIARREPTALDMIQSVIEKGVTSENVAALRELVELKRVMDADAAQRAFASAFVDLQSQLPTITAKTVIQNRGKYERFEDVMEAIKKPLQANGFTVSFTMDFKENRILETCHLTHIGGFTRSNSFAVRVGKGDTETQADCKAATTAKRNALLNALNIVIRQDCLNNEEDASIEGDPNAKITLEQADELERRAKMTNSNIPAFLKLAKADMFRNIPANQYATLDSLLARKENQGR